MNHIENMNYLNDHRVRAAEEQSPLGFDEKSMTLTYNYEDDEGNVVDVVFPAKFVVCPTCDGKGHHVNPSVDAGGITGADWADWDQDDREAYFSGAYDVTCYGCHGNRVVPTIDEDHLKPEQQEALKKLEEQLEADAEFDRISRMERAMGA